MVLADQLVLCRCRGTAMMQTMAAVAMVFILGLTFLAGQGTMMGVSENVVNAPQARAIAESALAIAIEHIKTHSDWRTSHPHGVWFQDEPLLGGTFTVHGEDEDDNLSNDPSQPVILTATGYWRGISHAVSVRMVPVPVPVPAGTPLPIVTGTSVALRNAAKIDSFDSSVGPYGGANIGANAMVTTNSTNGLAIELRDTSRIEGNVQVAVGGGVSQGGSTVITGTVTNLAQALEVMTPVAPTGMPSSSGNTTYGSGTNLTISENKRYGSFTLQGNAIVNIQGHVTFQVGGSFLIENTAQLRILPNSSLKIYYESNFTITNDGKLNMNTGNPTLVTIYNIGVKDLNMLLSGQLAAQVQTSPSYLLDMRGNSQFFGTFNGRGLDLRDSAMFHQDVRSGSPGGGDGSAVTYATFWIEGGI